MRLYLFCQLFFFTVFPVLGGDVFFGPGEIHYEHDDIMQRYQAGDASALAELKQLCYRAHALAFYSCYHAARIEAEAGRSKSSDELLERALKLRPDFTEALNFALRRESPALSAGNAGLVHFELAAKAARENKAALALEHIREAIRHGLTQRAWYEGHPDFQKLRQQPRFQALVRYLPAGEERARVIRRMMAARDTGQLFDPAYNLARHRQAPDNGELLYHYFEAYEKVREPAKALEHLKVFFSQFEGIPQSQQVLAGYAVVFLWQHERFQPLRQYQEGSDFLKTMGKRYGIPGSFFE